MSLAMWCATWRRQEPPTARDIRGQLHSAREQHAATLSMRNDVAIDALRDELSARRWRDLGATANRLLDLIDVLAAALPAAVAREAAAQEEAAAADRERRAQTFAQHTADAQKVLDAALSRLPDGEALTALRDWRDLIRAEAAELRPHSNAVHVRRPLDSLEVIRAAMVERIECIDRARWAPNRPVTLRKRSAS